MKAYKVTISSVRAWSGRWWFSTSGCGRRTQQRPGADGVRRRSGNEVDLR